MKGGEGKGGGGREELAPRTICFWPAGVEISSPDKTPYLAHHPLATIRRTSLACISSHASQASCNPSKMAPPIISLTTARLATSPAPVPPLLLERIRCRFMMGKIALFLTPICPAACNTADFHSLGSSLEIYTCKTGASPQELVRVRHHAILHRPCGFLRGCKFGEKEKKTRRQHRHTCTRGTDMWPQTPKCTVHAARINQFLVCCRLLGHCAILKHNNLVCVAQLA